MPSTLVIACPTCMQKLRAPEGVIGREITCPQCKNAFTAEDPNAATGEVPKAPRQDSVSDDPSTWGSIPAKPGRTPRKGSFGDYLVFRRMVTPVIIVAVFYFGVVLIVLGGVVNACVGIFGGFGGRGSVVYGLAMMAIAFFSTIFSLVMWRVFCEVLIAMFRILDNVREINEQMKSKP
jgi:hypothetical protein